VEKQIQYSFKVPGEEKLKSEEKKPSTSAGGKHHPECERNWMEGGGSGSLGGLFSVT